MNAPVGPDQLASLLEAHGAALELFAAQWSESADDCVQEAFIELARQGQSPDRVVAWLYRVVRNRAISHARSAGRRRKYEAAAANQSAPWFEPSPGSALDARAATLALQELSPAHREVIVARIWGGLSFEQIAELVGASISTAHRRYFEGLSHLRERLGLSWITSQSSQHSTRTT
jgi:RNA polymerase sigma-70 factor (ECF subfamily)